MASLNFKQDMWTKYEEFDSVRAFLTAAKRQQKSSPEKDCPYLTKNYLVSVPYYYDAVSYLVLFRFVIDAVMAAEVD